MEQLRQGRRDLGSQSGAGEINTRPDRQAQKFAGTQRAQLIQEVATPRQAKDLGHDRTVPLRSDWDEVRDAIMRLAVLRKFQMHKEARAVLLGTGDEDIIEDSPTDY
jgi:ribA/ribD-fused uncharacterized protein